MEPLKNRALRRKLERQSAELRARNEDLRALTDNIPGGVFRCTAAEPLTLLQVSDGFLSMFGYSRAEIKDLFQDSFWLMIHPDDRENALREAQRQLQYSNTKEIEYRVDCKDGHAMWVLDKGQLVKSKDAAEPDTYYCIVIDITNTKKVQEELRLSLERHQIIMDQTTDIIFEWDIAENSLMVSQNWEKKFGYPVFPAQSMETALKNAPIHPDDQEGALRLVEDARRGAPYTETELRIANSEGRYIWCRIRASVQFDGAGKPIKSVGVIVDIDSEKRLMLNLLDKAEKDALTGLYNRGTAQKLVESVLETSQPEEACALLIIDVDNFKQINDSRGHLFGDAVLSAIAGEMKKLFRVSDVIGRIGGDEFLVFLKGIPSREFVFGRADKTLGIFNRVLNGQDCQDRISCSIGVSLFPQDGRDFHSLYHSADTALYAAKKQGKNCVLLFDGHK
ncbi:MULTISPECIES: GGDEF domain-containing protein [Anaerotruncus]|uniref:GGDEF domain-containing protein n=1 Tax=Anaerotruncus TaxID=244127 RepID=UPI0008357EDA|nr:MULTISPECIES: sensor domain-containing diguanylate cyclase [Anaerotruncus]RGX55509.1 sensor domain-containing diguanylate cyclase [Anaerotruncus sp. AF02-27]